jgi:hypothetical protein
MDKVGLKVRCLLVSEIFSPSNKIIVGMIQFADGSFASEP